MKGTKAIRTMALTAVSLALIAPPSAAEPKVQTENYTAGFLGDAELNFCADESPTGENLDRVCFDVSANERYKVQITDIVNGSHIGYLWVFRNAQGDCVGDTGDPLEGCPNSGLTCGTQVLPAPPGAKTLTILLDGPVYGPLDCLVDGPGDSIGTATQGEVKLTRQD
ncbi:MAG TPA: hypothetical protein VGB83_11220 [Actinomycetota bacterium]